jgi:hypothetical protein
MKQELKKNMNQEDRFSSFFELYYSDCSCYTFCMTNDSIPKEAKVQELTVMDNYYNN